MAEVKNLRLDLEEPDKQMLVAVAKARGAISLTQCIRDLIRGFYEGVAQKLDPASLELFEKGELDHRAYGKALLNRQRAAVAAE